jgi:RNA polymerase sigma-70 factor, ECF subfamily
VTDRAFDALDGSSATLGALLYADGSGASVPEDEWVALVQSIAAGDEGALRALYERTHRLVFTLAVRIAGDRESAEEVTLDVFRDVWLRSANYAPENGSVVGWIMNQARSRAIDRLRFERRKKRVPPDPVGPGTEPAEEPDAALEGERRRGSLHAALTALTEEERQAIETAFFLELTYSETALRLNLPIGTVKTRIRSAISKLRQEFGREGGPR